MRSQLDGPRSKGELPALLEGYLFGLGEVCHELFGADGEVTLYRAIGSRFLAYLERSGGVTFSSTDPWERYCQIIEHFTACGFYDHVELEDRGDGTFWMLETNQYAGAVWEDQNAWQRGTPPCPLWSVILSSLSQIGWTIRLDSVAFDASVNGYESTFHFEPDAAVSDPIAAARGAILDNLMRACSYCRRIEDNGQWIEGDLFLVRRLRASVSHGVCPSCMAKHHPEVATGSGRTAGLTSFET